MLFEDTYLTIKEPSEGDFRDRGSKFIGYAYPLVSEQQVKEHLAYLRAVHTGARHFCWAMRLTPDRSVFRINDDGEPSGTGGRPILNVLLSHQLTNIVIVVVRYFGGTLLGVPGLINAYKTAAEEAVKAAQIVEKTVNDIYTIRFEYLQMNDVMKLIKDQHLEVLEQQFDNQCSIQVSVRKMQVNEILSRVGNISNAVAEFNYSS
jgi:uncharacterized YigZ family protein